MMARVALFVAFCVLAIAGCQALMPKIPGMDAAQKMGVEASSKVIGSAMTEIIQKSIKLMEEVATSMVMARSNADFQKVLADALNAFYEMQQIAMGVAQQMM